MRRTTKPAVAATSALILMIGASAAKAELNLDQSFFTYNYESSSAAGGLAQTFTVGLGGQLSVVGIQVQLLEDATLTISRTTSSGAPSFRNSAVLASVQLPTVSASATPTWIDVNLSAFNIQVTPGERFAITFSGGSEIWDAGLTTPGPGYTGGSAYYLGSTAGGRPAWLPMDTLPFGYADVGYDFDFATYVDTPIFSATAPEPSTLVPALIGSVLLAGRMWRRDRRTGPVAECRC